MQIPLPFATIHLPPALEHLLLMVLPIFLHFLLGTCTGGSSGLSSSLNFKQLVQ